MQQRIFGKRDWSDVRKVVAARIWERFPGSKSDDIDDALSLAMVDLVDYWVELPSSNKGGPEDRFWKACNRATWMATTFLIQGWRNQPVPTAEPVHPNEDAGECLEDELIDTLDRERLGRFIEERPADHSWLRPFLAGITTYEQALREGVSQSAIVQRWGTRRTNFVRDAQAALA